MLFVTIQQRLRRGKKRLMNILSGAKLTQKAGKITVLGKAGKLGRGVQPNVGQALDSSSI